MNKYKCVKLKELRLEKGFSKKELACKLGITLYRLTRLENLTLMANLYEMACLTYYLDAKLNYITGESSVRKYPENLFYDEFESYEKKHNTIKLTKK